MRIAKIDTSVPQRVLVTFHPVDGTVEEFQEYMEALINIIKNLKERSVVIFDGSNGKFIDSDCRMVIVQYLKENKTVYQEKVISSIAVTASSISTVVLKLLMPMMDKEIRSEVFSSLNDAIKWADRKIDRERQAA